MLGRITTNGIDSIVPILEPEDGETHFRTSGENPTRSEEHSDSFMMDIMEPIFDAKRDGKIITKFYLEMTTADPNNSISITYVPDGILDPDDDDEVNE